MTREHSVARAMTAPDKELAGNLLQAGFQHLIFSLPPLDARSALVTLDSCADFVRRLRD